MPPPSEMPSSALPTNCRQAGGGASAAATQAPSLQWLQPQRVLHRPDDGIASLAAGSFSAAAITGAGDLYLWGTVLSEDASQALLKQSGACLQCFHGSLQLAVWLRGCCSCPAVVIIAALMCTWDVGAGQASCRRCLSACLPACFQRSTQSHLKVNSNRRAPPCPTACACRGGGAGPLGLQLHIRSCGAAVERVGGAGRSRAPAGARPAQGQAGSAGHPPRPSSSFLNAAMAWPEGSRCPGLSAAPIDTAAAQQATAAAARQRRGASVERLRVLVGPWMPFALPIQLYHHTSAAAQMHPSALLALHSVLPIAVFC